MDQVQTVRQLKFRGEKVLLRVDFNVPLDDTGNISDDTRIRASLPTIQHILNRGASLILMSHLGRPKGVRAEYLSLKPCALHLAKLLGRPVKLAPDCMGEETETMAAELEEGEILLLENLRFHEAEEHPEKDPSFAQKIAGMGTLYVNDAFGTAHRKHASTYEVAKRFPRQSACGFLMEKEIAFLGHAVKKPERPFLAIIGGAKISSKIGIVKSLIEKVDGLLIAGGMAYTFLKAQGAPIGKSLCEKDQMETAKEIIHAAKEKKVDLILPADSICVESLNDLKTKIICSHSEGIPENMMGVDIGPETVSMFRLALKKARTVIWNGPLGIFETPPFDEGTFAIAHSLAALRATTIVGGGDSVAAIQQAKLADTISHLSTGGGASLEFLEKGTLPCIEVLTHLKH